MLFDAPAGRIAGRAGDSWRAWPFHERRRYMLHQRVSTLAQEPWNTSKKRLTAVESSMSTISPLALRIAGSGSCPGRVSAMIRTWISLCPSRQLWKSPQQAARHCPRCDIHRGECAPAYLGSQHGRRTSATR